MGAAAAVAAEAIFKIVDRDPPISRRTLEFFTTNNVFDITAARTTLGFTPAYSFEAGLSTMRSSLEAASLPLVA
jgi:nucleoside-diphosphate-sugar epimerase